jgi:hypothetical protein
MAGKSSSTKRKLQQQQQQQADKEGEEMARNISCGLSKTPGASPAKKKVPEFLGMRCVLHFFAQMCRGTAHLGQVDVSEGLVDLPLLRSACAWLSAARSPPTTICLSDWGCTSMPIKVSG